MANAEDTTRARIQAARIIGAHEHSSNHRSKLSESSFAGCFYCESIFSPSEVKEWIDGGETALCPKCGIDSVIGDRSGFPITAKFLSAMNRRWFATE